MDNIIEEVQDERAYRHRVAIFQKVLIATFVVGVVAIALFVVWSSNKAKKVEESSQMSAMLLNIDGQKNFGMPSEIADLEDKIAKNTTEFVNFARLHLAGIHFRQKNYAKSVEAFRAVLGSTDAPESLRHYARIMLVSIALDHPSVIKQEDLDSYVKDLDVQGTPFVYNAKIVKALYLIKENKTQEAQVILNSIIKAQDVSDVIKVQAAALL